MARVGRKNWGTKWGAYDVLPVENDGNHLILRFKTAWSPPRGWLVAIFNKFKLSFYYHYLSEGEARGHVGHFDWQALDDLARGHFAWNEKDAPDELNCHLHVLLWGDAAADDLLKDST